MPKTTVDGRGRLALPADFRERRRIDVGTEYWVEEREGELVLLPRAPDMAKLYVEPTTACNLQCQTCIRQVWDTPEGFLPLATFRQVAEGLNSLRQLGRVVFTGFGEPLLHPDLLEMIAAVRQRKIAVTVGSNGLLLDGAMSQELVRLGVDRLVVSVDGVRPETYEGIRGARLAQVLENIRGLNEAKARAGSLVPALGFEFVALRSNVAELADLTGLASRMNAARVVVSNVLCYTPGMRSQILYGYEPRSPLDSAGWPVKIDAWVTWGTLDLPRMHWGAERRCRFVQDRAAVLGWDGGVSPCYALSHSYRYYAVDGREKQVARYSFGNVQERSLADIWMSEDYARFRSAVREFRFPSCPDCDLRESCDLREHNEACWGWSPSCADCLWAQDIIRCP